jgi:hypothetical protein
MTSTIDHGRLALPAPLYSYSVDAHGMVWRSGVSKLRTRLRRGQQPFRTETADKPLKAVTFHELLQNMGESRSHRDKACVAMYPGIWQLRPIADAKKAGANAPWWNSWRPDPSMTRMAHRCWFEIVLPSNRTHHESANSLNVDSRDHFPFIIMGKLAFLEIVRQSQ